MSEEDKKELHAKLNALIEANFLVLAALINQLHYETFFRRSPPEGHIDSEFDRAIRGPTSGESAQLKVLEALIWAVLNEQPDADRVFCDLIRSTFRRYAEDRI